MKTSKAVFGGQESKHVKSETVKAILPIVVTTLISWVKNLALVLWLLALAREANASLGAPQWVMLIWFVPIACSLYIFYRFEMRELNVASARHKSLIECYYSLKGLWQALPRNSMYKYTLGMEAYNHIAEELARAKRALELKA